MVGCARQPADTFGWLLETRVGCVGSVPVILVSRSARGLGPVHLVCALALVIVSLGVRPALAVDPLEVRRAAQQVRAAAGSLAGVVSRLPLEAQKTLAGEVQILVEAADHSVARIADLGVPIVDQTLVHDLHFLSDLIYSLETELVALENQGGGEPGAARRARIDQLFEAAAAQIEQIDPAIARWLERTQRTVVDLENDAGVVIVRSIDRTMYDAIRYTALGLLMVGLLLVGLRFLEMGVLNIDPRELIRHPPAATVASLVALAMFFLATLALAIRPDALAIMSAQVEVERPEHPCRTLAVQRDHLASAQLIDNATLLQATRQRMRRSAEDCLGLPDQAVAAAIERIGARGVPITAASAREMIPVPGAGPFEETPTSEVAAAEPAGAGASAPAATEVEPGTEERDVLAELLAEIENLEEDAAAENGQPNEDVPADVAGLGDDPPGPADAVAAGGSAPTAAEAQPRLFVTTAAVNYRAAPDINAERLGTFVAGARLNVLRQERGWSEVRLPDGRDVYVANDFLEPAS